MSETKCQINSTPAKKMKKDISQPVSKTDKGKQDKEQSEIANPR